MTEGLYQWVENIAFYMVFMTAALHLIPGDGYRKYLKFFTGMILILLVISPVLRVVGMEQTFHEIFEERIYEEKLRNIEKETSYLKKIQLEEYLPLKRSDSEPPPENREAVDRMWREDSGKEKEGEKRDE